MNKLEHDLVEIETFVSSFHVKSPITSSAENRSKFKSTYKQFHAMLIWSVVAEAQPQKALPTKTYIRETLSDLSHAVFLTLLGIYKPARAALRSAVENFIRVLLLMRDRDVSGIGTVYNLFAQAKAEFKNDAQMLKYIHQLEASYGELCKTVHSAKVDYMSLTVPFERLSRFDTSRYQRNLDHLRNVCALANQAMFWLWHRKLGVAGHLNDDLVRDAVPRSLKRAIGDQS
jgi:hypothetical protein